ncbi:MAG: 50S ribosomal protein L16 [Candidatus Pacebacteria bacterium GW2011_GWF2_38_9]|nr:MAG: 50S ribosomal protein L16, large subunit ribosomal protein L16 [candidate division TM6 bacterium GW2011_GWF2_28_16]KKQ88564.1 MAG: 50S ribosomal protein L16 [Candidatus Pacebacteria bacterium GW2011_GWF2_38_9]MBU1033537.1 50S ribosomal protein L16 [Patescibacteria group bacterium]HAZ73529.1 50S ribosomal protein L16 [Candidatus Paceibacterota bacterium]
MLQPKKVKYRKTFRGKNRGKALRGCEIVFGEYGLRSLSLGEISARQIEAARKKITYATKREGKYWIKIFPHKPLTQKPLGVKMGSGKGAIEEYVALVKPGVIMFEIGGVSEEIAKSAMQKAAAKLSVKTEFVKKK